VAVAPAFSDHSTAGAKLDGHPTGECRSPGEEMLMKQEVKAAFEEMMDISTDIDKAVLFDPTGALASNMTEDAQAAAVAQARELVRLGETRAVEMGSQPFTQLVIETPAGYVFVARETRPGGMAILATGKKGSRVGLVLYDLKTCLRDARESETAGAPDDSGSKED
jgi:predicted regulator of Ras-like GTPase activity (Roadblock/LC7/MglB family)